MKRFVLAVLTVSGFWAAAAVRAEDKKPAAPEAKADAAAPLPADLEDPPFDRYVSLAKVREALVALDAVRLCDLAAKLTEGEQALGRPRKGLSAADLLKGTLRIAREKKDRATLDKLATLVKARGDKELLADVATAQKLARAPRKSAVALTAPDDLSPEAQAVYKSFVEEIRLSKSLGDADRLGQLEKGVSLLRELPEKQRTQLALLVKEAKAEAPEKGDREAQVLSRLARSSRAVKKN